MKIEEIKNREDFMKIMPLGVNGAFTKNYHNNYIVKANKKRNILIDAGTTLRYSLPKSCIDVTSITDIFITHLHSDHVGGLEEFLQRCKFIHNHKPNLWIRRDMEEQLHNILRNGLETDEFNVYSFANIQPVDTTFMVDDLKFTVINTDNLHCNKMKSNALRIKDLTTTEEVIFSGDIQNLEDSKLREYINNDTATVFNDCTTNRANPVHSFIDDVVDYYDGHIDRSKIYMMHYEDDLDITSYEKEYGVKFLRERVWY